MDTLNKCQDDSIANFLKHLVRTRLYRPSKTKWLLASRPLDIAKPELLAGPDQVLVSLELNSKHISKAAMTYIACKMDKPDCRYRDRETLQQEIQSKLTEKAKDMYL
jgi:hypothetical protein